MAVTKVFAADEALNGDLARLYDFVAAVRARLLLITVFACISGIAALVVAYIITPIYRATAVLAPIAGDPHHLGSDLDSGKGAAGGSLSAIASAEFPDIDRDTDEAMTVLRSREFTEAFIRDNNLLPVLFPKLWDGRAGRWKSGIKVPTLQRGYVEFDKIRKIDVDSVEDFITLQIDWSDRMAAADWVNQMAQRLNDELRRRAIESSDASLAYLQKEMQTVEDVSTRQAVGRLIEAEIRRRMLAHVSEEFEVRVIDEALAADADLPQSPNKILLTGSGVAFGLLVGIAISLGLYHRELAASGRL
jgi:capsular polysaccharide biosynthesis protein